MCCRFCVAIVFLNFALILSQKSEKIFVFDTFEICNCSVFLLFYCQINHFGKVDEQYLKRHVHGQRFRPHDKCVVVTLKETLFDDFLCLTDFGKQ